MSATDHSTPPPFFLIDRRAAALADEKTTPVVTRGRVSPTPLGLCAMGLLALAVDAGALFALVERFAYPVLVARFASMLGALAVIWGLHLRVGRDSAGWVRFVGASALGAATSFAAFAVVLLAFPGTPLMLILAMGWVAGLGVYAARRH